MRCSKILSGFALFCCLAIAGCGGGSGTTVTGEVTFNGKPLEKGYITFNPVDGKSSSVGAEITNGKYTAKNVVPGQSKVVVTSTVVAGPVSDSMEAGVKAAKKAAAPTADSITLSTEGNNQTHDIPSSSFELNLTLKASIGSDGKVR